MAVDSGKEKKRKEIVLNTVLNTVRIVKSFSIRSSELDVLQQFLLIARAEEGPRGFSDTILNAMKEYNQRHGEGNPQLKIASYLPDAETGPIRVLCWSHLAGAASEGKVYCRKYGGAWIQGIRCYSCPYNQLRKKETVKHAPQK